MPLQTIKSRGRCSESATGRPHQPAYLSHERLDATACTYSATRKAHAAWTRRSLSIHPNRPHPPVFHVEHPGWRAQLASSSSRHVLNSDRCAIIETRASARGRNALYSRPTSVPASLRRQRLCGEKAMKLASAGRGPIALARPAFHERYRGDARISEATRLMDASALDGNPRPPFHVEHGGFPSGRSRSPNSRRARSDSINPPPASRAVGSVERSSYVETEASARGRGRPTLTLADHRARDSPAQAASKLFSPGSRAVLALAPA